MGGSSRARRPFGYLVQRYAMTIPMKTNLLILFQNEPTHRPQNRFRQGFSRRRFGLPPGAGLHTIESSAFLGRLTTPVDEGTGNLEGGFHASKTLAGDVAGRLAGGAAVAVRVAAEGNDQ
jgi:hypothetical protein